MSMSGGPEGPPERSGDIDRKIEDAEAQLKAGVEKLAANMQRNPAELSDAQAAALEPRVASLWEALGYRIGGALTLVGGGMALSAPHYQGGGSLTALAGLAILSLAGLANWRRAGPREKREVNE